MTEPDDRPRPWVRALADRAPVLLGTVLAGLLVTSGWFWYEGRGSDDGRAAAVTAGRSAALLFFSLDHTHVHADVNRLLAGSTGSFRKEYAAQRSDLEKQVEAKRLTVHATAPTHGTALEFLSPRRAQVLVAVNTTTTLDGGHSERSAYRTRVVLSHVGGRWLVAGLEQVG